MTDTTLNRFLMSGNNAARLAYTPNLATPASGPDPTLVWFETDTSNTYAWDFGASTWVQVNGGLGAIADGDLLANISGSTAAPIANTLSNVIDHAIGSTQGDVLYRSASGWTVLAPGTSGNVFKTGGASANPSWGTVALSGMANLAANSIIGNNTGSAATPIALTQAQATALLNAMVGDSGSGGTKGLVPAPAAGDASKFLRGDGTFATPSGSGSSRLYSAFTNVGITASTTEQTLQSYTLPGGTLATDGQAIRVTVRGKYASTTRSRQLRLYFGSTVVTFMSSSTGSAFNVAQEAVIIRTGATTQIAFGPSEIGATNTTTVALRFVEFNDPAETLASDVVIKVTGQSGSGAAANDVSCDLFMVELLP
jgi:hypothetical protein